MRCGPPFFLCPGRGPHRGVRTPFSFQRMRDYLGESERRLRGTSGSGRRISNPGKTRGAYDLMIVAMAAATVRIVITMDSSAAFDDLPGVRAQVVPR